MSSLPQSCPLLSLPPEIIYLISDRLTHRRAAFFARTCHALHAIITPKLDRYFKYSCYMRLIWAACHDKPDTLERGFRIRAANTNADPGEDWTDENAIFLHKAIYNRSTYAVRFLLAQRVDPNRKAKGSVVVPLTAAVMKGDVEIASMLLEAGADVNYRPEPGDGWPATAVASWSNNEEMVKLLMQYYPDIPYDSDADEFCSGDDHESDSEEEDDPDSSELLVNAEQPSTSTAGTSSLWGFF
ncbi:hypothetical protein DFP73DRAFT_561515 [Morchella snyderi]|nr:hypothetical protein DFP73DRAFT_561515 [Morchella snyderi]